MSEQDARDFLTALGAEIAAWRKRRGLTRAELGQRVELSETTIGRIERGEASAAAATTDVWRIAANLDLPFSDLVRRAEDAVDLTHGSPYQVQDEAARPPRGRKPRIGDN